MSRIVVTCQGYAGAWTPLNGSGRLGCTKRSVLLASLVVGAQSGREWREWGWRRLGKRAFDAMGTLFMLQNSTDGLQLHNSYKDPDSSEIGMSSQLLGMAFAKVAASRVLSIRWLAQVDKMKAQGALTTTAGSNQRGDLVGHDDASKWHVIEAKGRSDPYAISVVAHAKTQASKVTSVEGQVPETTSACITSLHAKPISVLLDDPAADDKEDEAWEVDRERFFEVYYEGIIRALNEFKPRVIRTPRGVDFRVIKLRRILGRFADYIHPNLEFGLMEALYQSPQNAFEILNDYRVERDLKESIAGDGTALIGSSSRWEGE